MDSEELGSKTLIDSEVAHRRGFDIGVVNSTLGKVVLKQRQ